MAPILRSINRTKIKKMMLSMSFRAKKVQGLMLKNSMISAIGLKSKKNCKVSIKSRARVKAHKNKMIKVKLYMIILIQLNLNI